MPSLRHRFEMYNVLNDTPFNNGRTAFLAEMDECCNPYMTSNATLHQARDWHRGWCLEREELRDATRV
jgi:hypothetical protein